MKSITTLGIAFLLICSPGLAQIDGSFTNQPATIDEAMNLAEFQWLTVQLSELTGRLNRAHDLGELDENSYRQMTYSVGMAGMEVMNDYGLTLPKTNALLKDWTGMLWSLTNSVIAEVPNPNYSNRFQFGGSELLARMKQRNEQLCSAPDHSMTGIGTEIPGLRDAMRAYPSNPQFIPPRDSSLYFNYVCGISSSSDVSGSQVIGSCFLLTNDYFATAFHVLKGKSDLYVFSSEPASGDILPKYVFRIDPASYIVDANKDICVFRTHPTTDGVFATQVMRPAPCFEAGSRTPFLARLKIAGFPRQAILPVLTDNIFFIEYLQKWDSVRGDLLAMGPTWKGYSGAPLMMDNGCVIGIVRWQAFPEDTSEGIAVKYPPLKEYSFGSVRIENALALLQRQQSNN